jgi:hypothetical protein
VSLDGILSLKGVIEVTEEDERRRTIAPPRMRSLPDLSRHSPRWLLCDVRKAQRSAVC